MDNLSNGILNFHGVYTLTQIRDGIIIDQTTEDNVVTIEGRTHICESYFASGTAGTKYIGLFTGNITPTQNDVMATFLTNALEFTGYAETQREQLVAVVTSGNVSNTTNKAEFTINATGTIRGVFLSTNNVKNGTSGVLVSAKRFDVDRTVNVGDILQIEWNLTTSST